MARGCLMRIRPFKRGSVERVLAPSAGIRYSRAPMSAVAIRKSVSSAVTDRRYSLQLLDGVAAFLQQRNHAARAGEMKRTCNNCCRFPGFQFGFDPRNPFHITVFDEAGRNARCFFAQSRVACPKRVGVTAAPCFVHPAGFLRSVPRLTERIAQHEFAVAIRHSTHHRHVLINRLKPCYFFSCYSRVVHKVIVQTM